jgi:hypothetical protein
MLKRLAAGTDYFANLGDIACKAAAVALTPFALFFSLGALLTPIAAVCIGFSEDWRLAGIVLGSGVLYAVIAIPLCWVVFRLYRGRRAANGVTILPTWLVRIFLIGYLGPITIFITIGMGVLAFQAADNHDWKLAAIWIAGACGFAVSWVRALPRALALGKQGRAVFDPVAAQRGEAPSVRSPKVMADGGTHDPR